MRDAAITVVVEGISVADQHHVLRLTTNFVRDLKEYGGGKRVTHLVQFDEAKADELSAGTSLSISLHGVGEPQAP